MIKIYSEDLPRAFELPNSILNDCDQSKPLIALRQANTMELDRFTAIRMCYYGAILVANHHYEYQASHR